MPNAQLVAKLAGFALVAAAFVPTGGLLAVAPAAAAGQAQPAVAPATCLSGPGDLDGDGPPDLAAISTSQGAPAASTNDSGVGASGERTIVKSKSNITNNHTDDGN